MKRPDLRKVREKVENCFRTYPMEIITGVIYFIINVVTHSTSYGRPNLSNTQAFFPTVIVVAYALNIWLRRRIAAVYYAVPLLMIASFALFYKELDSFTDSIGYGCTLIATMALFFACARDGENRAFSAETLSKAVDLALSVFTALLFTGVMAAIYGSVEYLFGVVVSIYDNTLVFSLYIIVPVLFLTMHDKPSAQPGKFISVILNYILHPAILVYTIILYLYTAKIVMIWTLPEGNVAYMVTAFIVASIAGQMFWTINPKKVYGWYYRNLMWIAIVPLVLFWTGVVYRVNAYGLTEARVYLAVFGVVMTASVLMHVVRRVYRYQWMLFMAVAAFAVFTYIPGLSADDIGLRSQIGRVRSLASELGLLDKNDRLTGTAQFTPKDDAQRKKAVEICEAYDYVYYNISDDRISDYDERAGMVERILGKDEFVRSELQMAVADTYLSCPAAAPLPIGGYIRAYLDCRIMDDTILFGNGGKIPVPGKDYFARNADVYKKYAKEYSSDDYKYRDIEPFIFRNDTCMVVFDQLYGSELDGSWTVSGGSGCDVFVK